MLGSAIETPEYFLREEPYTGNHDFFYKTEDYPAIKELEANWHIIKDELAALISNQEEIQAKNLNPPYLSSPDAWKILYFYNFGWKTHKNCDLFPKTHALLKTIPNMTFGGITVLQPKSKVLPHYGETNAIIRCHLGLKIPASYPTCGVKIGTAESGWEEGKVIMFSDAHLHTAWNDSNEKRYVLVFDIVRNEYADQKHMVCANVLGALSLKFFYSKRPGLKKLPMPIIKTAHFVFKSFWYIYLPLQNHFRLP
jgi:aspartyl/asparaginyl beta-hydroxylase (cupin superfamily)